MPEPDPIFARLSAGIELRLQAHYAEARVVFEQLWTEIGGATGNPLYRCAIAHSLADAQDDVHNELRWDLAALDAAQAITDDQVAAAGMGDSAAALFPSLHLNLAHCYSQTGDLDQARAHLDRGLQAAVALPDGEYADSIRNGLNQLEQRLAG